jgi:GTP pyrophosphokinase
MLPLNPNITIGDVLSAAANPLENEEKKFLLAVAKFATDAHYGQSRKSGEPYIVHSLHAARTLAEIGMDSVTIAAGLLHDVPEDTPITLDEISKKFGKEVAYLVDGITKLSKVRLEGSEKEYFLENLRKMFLAMAKDIRVVIIKLADRLHNMRTLEALPEEKRGRIARETFEVYVPIANRLGIGEMKAELEDLCFKFLEPEKFTEVKKIEAAYLNEGQVYLERVKESVTALLKKEAIQVEDIEARTKNLYRLNKKLEAHDMDIKRIYDLLAIRIIVPTISNCYEALGIIHREYRPMVGRIKDYISLPKPNGYQSLHTTIFGPEGRILEIQIRTGQMNDEAEYGIAAHWMYTEKHKNSWRDFFIRKKDAPKVATKIKENLSWITQLREWQKDIGRDDSEFMEGLKIEFFKNHIFAFTPKGDIVELPEEATPVDFAYAIHTEVGHRTNGAKADGKMVSLDYHIKNAEVIEIMTSKELKKPNKDWLRFVKTSHAKQSIRREHRIED